MSQRGQQKRPRRGLVALVAVLGAAVLLLDQVTKQVAVSSLQVGEYHPLLGDLFGLSLVFNSGAAFSLGEDSTWLFTIAMVVVTVVILLVCRRLRSRAWAVALGALLGGTLGNLGDRLFRDPGFAVGHVVDFLNYNGWFVGNVADIAIVLSAIGIAVLSFIGISVDGRRAGAGKADGAATEGKHVATPEAEPGDDEPADDEPGEAEPGEAGEGASPTPRDEGTARADG